MILTYTRFLSHLSTSVFRKHSRKFSHLLYEIKIGKYPSTRSQILRKCFCEKPEDLYAAINEEDFEIPEEISNYKDVDFEKIAEGDQEKVKILKRIQLEIDMYAQDGGEVPNKISTDQWIDFLSLPTKTQRMKRIKLLWTNESKKLIKKQKQALFKKEYEEHKITAQPRKFLTSNSPMEYGLLRTTLFHRIYETDMKNLYNFRLLQAAMFGPHLIIDCGFEEYMKPSDLSFCVRDLLKSWSNNREHFYPFDMIFCNLDKNSKLFSKLSGVFPAPERDPTCPFNFTNKHYLDLFPKEKLVYLTPHCNEEMKSFEGDSIYIIGGVSDKSNEMALTLAKAKKEGIRRIKLPLDKYLKWNFGKKTLSITECVDIMNDLKDGKSWNFSLRRVRMKQMTGSSRTYSDEAVTETNTKTAEHLEELLRIRNIYDVLLSNKAKKGRK